MLRLHNVAAGKGMSTIHRVVRSLGKGLETLVDLATYEVAGQILKLVMGQTREIISHAPRLSAHLVGRQATGGTIASCLSITNKKINALSRRCGRMIVSRLAKANGLVYGSRRGGELCDGCESFK